MIKFLKLNLNPIIIDLQNAEKEKNWIKFNILATILLHIANIDNSDWNVIAANLIAYNNYIMNINN